jgi:hypothetical protein
MNTRRESKTEAADATRLRQRERLEELTRVACANEVLNGYKTRNSFVVIASRH